MTMLSTTGISNIPSASTRFIVAISDAGNKDEGVNPKNTATVSMRGSSRGAGLAGVDARRNFRFTPSLSSAWPTAATNCTAQMFTSEWPCCPRTTNWYLPVRDSGTGMAHSFPLRGTLAHPHSISLQCALLLDYPSQIDVTFWFLDIEVHVSPFRSPLRF